MFLYSSLQLDFSRLLLCAQYRVREITAEPLQLQRCKSAAEHCSDHDVIRSVELDRYSLETVRTMHT